MPLHTKQVYNIGFAKEVKYFFIKEEASDELASLLFKELEN